MVLVPMSQHCVSPGALLKQPNGQPTAGAPQVTGGMQVKPSEVHVGPGQSMCYQRQLACTGHGHSKR
jgi:hypothetical protein